MKNKIRLLALLLITGLFSAHEVWARGGGGGSGGGGGGGGSGRGGSGIINGIALIVGLFFAIFFAKIRKDMLAKAKANLKIAEQTDSTWNKTEITERVEKVFFEFQQAWSDLNAEAMKDFLSEEYYKRMVLELNVLKNEGRQNVLKNLKITALNIMDVNDQSDNAKDTFIIEVWAKAEDSLIDTKTGLTLFKDSSPFVEDWYFIRKDGEWYLDLICQKNSNAPSDEVKQFAKENNFYYDQDFGWLMMPNRGVVFKKTDFKSSDINYHVIGYYRNKIVEFYQYIPRPDSTLPTKYLIAQAILPRNYENILVRRKKWFNWTPSGLRHISSESVDFNKKFRIYASKNDQVSSLELLNPSFMEKIYALPFELNIEIVGNFLYLYTKKSSVQNLSKILEILSLAFDEMKM